MTNGNNAAFNMNDSIYFNGTNEAIFRVITKLADEVVSGLGTTQPYSEEGLEEKVREYLADRALRGC